jgi:hypothetical protein
LIVKVFTEYFDKREFDQCAEILFVDGDGKFITEPGYDVDATAYQGMDQNECNVFRTMRFPALFAISLMHCKNVKKIPRGRGTTPGRRNHKPCKFTYKVLDIEPMKRVLRTEGQCETVGLKRALHICRGHFKDFSEKGLFGKLHGVYWWDSQVRGNTENGVVFKDYRVHTNNE